MSKIGEIDCGTLALVQAAIDGIWADPIQKNDYVANVGVARAIVENQRVKFTELEGEKDRTVSVEWAQKCSVTTTSCTDDCTITGTDVTPKCKSYKINCLQETAFKVPERAYRTRTMDMVEAIAQNILFHAKALDEYLARYMVTGLAAAAGANAYTGGIGTVVGNNTSIKSQNWADEIWGYFNRVILENKFSNPYLITGDNLDQLLFDRFHERTNDNGKGNYSKTQIFRNIYQDPVNVEAIAANTSFIVHGGAAAFISKAWYPLGAANAEHRAGQYSLWSIESKNIPGVYYDVIQKESCESNDFHKAIKLQAHGLFAVNPEACGGNTGILKFTCV